MLFAHLYIGDEPFKERFALLVLLFVLSINLLIFIPHLIILLIGWDGLGIISFLLVAYYQSPKALGAAIITVISNRAGDAFMLMSIGLALIEGHWNILLYSSSSQTLLAILIMLAAMTKRAQIPFSAWLPAAIAAPTPVSALVHSSTLVTAGVFLLIRFYPFLSIYPAFHRLLLLIRCLTILIAGISAIFECDLKKIIALSTLRQLGVIMAALALAQPACALYHLITHALFKALLFICAGTIIHYHGHSQDIRHLGNLSAQLPITITAISIANLSLLGFPFLAGFFSKDLIIESAIFSNNNALMSILILLATATTVIYSVRLMFFTTFYPTLGAPVTNTSTEKHFSVPAILLTAIAITSGSALNWSHFSSLNTLFLCSKAKRFVPTLIIVRLFVSALNSFSLKSQNIPITRLSINTMWFIAPLSAQFILRLSPKTTSIITHLDQGWLELPTPKSTIFEPLFCQRILHKLLLVSTILTTSVMTLYLYSNSLKKA